jgi:hypothetical protein
MSEDGGYGADRPDVEQALRRGKKRSKPSRRVRPLPSAAPDQPFRPAVAQAPADQRTRGKVSIGEGPVLPLVLIGAGMYLAWFGVHYWRSDTKWPTDPIKSVLQGKGVPAPKQSPSEDEAAVLKAAQSQAGQSAAGTAAANQAVSGALGTGTGGGTSAQNKNLGKLLAGAYGWAGNDQWPYLESGWQEESGWDQHAANNKSDPYNHAYGIPQANPGTKMASAGGDWKDNPATQIRWGLAYIKATYGSPSRVPGWTPNGPAAGYQGY